MLRGSGNNLASAVLGKLAKHYLMDGIEEVAVNRPLFVWRKLRGGQWVEYPDAELTYEYLKQVCRVLANINGAKFSEGDMPIVSCELPGKPFRFQAVVGNNVRYELDDRQGVAIAIRSLMANTEIKFEHYGLKKGIKLRGAMQEWFGADLSDEAVEHIGIAIDNYQTVLVSGATSTGKTTFVNQVIKLIDEKKRIVTVEDAREVTVPHQNRVHLMVPRNRGANAIGYNQILDAIVRLTPEFVICGELSVYNAQPLFSLMGKGHPIITTVHASSPDEAMRAFVNNMASAGAGSGMTGEAVLDQLEAQIGCIVQLVLREGRRRVTEIVFPSRDRNLRLLAAGKKEAPAGPAKPKPQKPGYFDVELEA
jgi:type IV secretory pathway ATPase VirB11/archaellum biosynthesis ATPase